MRKLWNREEQVEDDFHEFLHRNCEGIEQLRICRTNSA